jgi:UDP-2,3-diacylglucosamine pyrophosphatase LpxH
MSGGEAIPSDAESARILRECEEREPVYTLLDVDLSLSGEDLIVVSDLHVGSGIGPDGRYCGTENFFCDGAFARFLRQMHDEAGERGAVLVINGDLVDFLRITEIPDRGDDLERWRSLLAAIGIERSVEDLRGSIAAKERRYGLRTDDYKSVWKLDVAMRGHPELFDALAWWVGEGGAIIITKGNHDLEWYWPAVRNALRLLLARRLAALDGRPLDAALLEDVVARLRFIDAAVTIDGEVRIEHGHLHDNYGRVIGGAVLPGGRELNIPFGSFINRYLLNRLESSYSFLDNIRPQADILPVLMRERFPLALSVLFRHLPLLFFTVRKRYYRYMLRRVVPFVIALALPILLIILWQQEWLRDLLTRHGTPRSFLEDRAFEVLQYVAGPLLAYIVSRLFAWLQLAEPDTLSDVAEEMMKRDDAPPIITFGHTHNPDQFTIGGKWFYNTGTWIPIVSTSTGDLRHDRTYVFLHLRRPPGGGPYVPSPLQRWDDAAGRGEPLPVIRRE